jgi:hypothetical protein
MNRVWQDVRYAIRQLRKSPGFTMTAVITLALGIGANTAIFTLVHAIMLRSLPVADPSQLYRIGDKGQCCVEGGFPEDAGTTGDFSIFSTDLYLHLRNSGNWRPRRQGSGHGLCAVPTGCRSICVASLYPAITSRHLVLELMRVVSSTTTTIRHQHRQRL